jgi:hypothetical protein
MNRRAGIFLILFAAGSVLSCQSQPAADVPEKGNVPSKPLTGMAAAANHFLQTLSDKQKEDIQFSFDNKERYNWHYIPKSRKGISLGEMNTEQKKAAMALMHTALSDTGFNKAGSIMNLEAILRGVEGRPEGDTYRDPGKYYFSVFGDPANDSIWGWRLEGHHISFNFSTANNRLVSGTPGFLGSNPAVVLSGPEKGKYILKDETQLGLALLVSLDAKQKEKAVINEKAPGDILTAASRTAMIEKPEGILYSELNVGQQKLFMQLLSVYIHRYTRLFAMDIMKEIETAGLNNLRFAWAGAQATGPGNPHYYRIQGPTIIIEYDNTQNDANHIHTVVRDLKNDFGGDELMEHYKSSH